MMKKMTNQEILAARRALEEVGLSNTDEDIEYEMKYDYLTINKSLMGGAIYAWYYDGVNESCVRVEDLESVDPEEVRVF